MIGGFQVGPFQTNYQQVSRARPPSVGAGRRRKTSQRIIARVNGELVEIGSVEELFRLLHKVKNDIPQIAEEKAVEILRTGKRIGEARSIEIIEAPARAKAVIEDRLEEMDRYYWKIVAKAIARIEQDDEEVILLIH